MSELRPKRILMIYDFVGEPEKMRLAVKHHLYAMQYSDVAHDITYYNAHEDAPPGIFDYEPSDALPDSLKNKEFDVIILHNGFLCYRWTDWYFYKWKKRFDWIRRSACPKFAIVQDEYDHSDLLDEWLYEWGISAIFSLYDYDHRKPLYPLMKSRAIFYSCLPGYIDESAAKEYSSRIKPIAERPIDIVYRANHLPYWFGSLGQMKHQVGYVVAARAKMLGFRCDISTESKATIFGNSWLDFLCSGKVVLGMEGGSSVIDWRGEARAQINHLLKTEPGCTFEQVRARMPSGWDDYKFKSITPRHFEAVIVKTTQLLVEGYYDGILEPDKHYIALRKDMSNLDEALEKLRDDVYLQEIADRAYRDIYLSGIYTYRNLAGIINDALLRMQQLADKGQTNMEITKPDITEVLERQLIAERHNYALLEAKLMDAVQQVGELQAYRDQIQPQLQGLQQFHEQDQGQLQQTHSQLQALQGQLQQIQSQLQEQIGFFEFRMKRLTYIGMAAVVSSVVSIALILLILIKLR